MLSEVLQSLTGVEFMHHNEIHGHICQIQMAAPCGPDTV